MWWGMDEGWERRGAESGEDRIARWACAWKRRRGIEGDVGFGHRRWEGGGIIRIGGVHLLGGALR